MLEVKLYPHPCLRGLNKVVKRFDEKLAALVRDMIAVMESKPHGIGIAAPQIGVNLRIAVVDVSSRIAGAKRLVLVNPEIIDQSEEILSREGCMSLPEYTANLKRYRHVRVRYQDIDGKVVTHTSQGIEAICIQHEVDHLKGMLFFDRVVALKTDMLPRVKSGF